MTGELQYFVREFEEKRNDREISQLEYIKANLDSMIEKDVIKLEKQLKETDFDDILTKREFLFLFLIMFK